MAQAASSASLRKRAHAAEPGRLARRRARSARRTARRRPRRSWSDCRASPPAPGSRNRPAGSVGSSAGGVPPWVRKAPARSACGTAAPIGRRRRDHIERRDHAGRRPRRDHAGLVAAVEWLAAARSRCWAARSRHCRCAARPSPRRRRARRRACRPPQTEEQAAAVGCKCGIVGHASAVIPCRAPALILATLSASVLRSAAPRGSRSASSILS